MSGGKRAARHSNRLYEPTRPCPQAVTVAVSLDGVMMPMKKGRGSGNGRANGPKASRRSGLRGLGAGCRTLSFYDAARERLTTVRMAPMPESKKATFRSILSAELSRALEADPALTLGQPRRRGEGQLGLPARRVAGGVNLLDFYHTVDHLNVAFDPADGEPTPKARSHLAKYRHVLLEGDAEVEKVIRASSIFATSIPGARNSRPNSSTSADIVTGSITRR